MLRSGKFVVEMARYHKSLPIVKTLISTGFLLTFILFSENALSKDWSGSSLLLVKTESKLRQNQVATNW